MLGKLLMTGSIALYAIVPPLVDLLTDTHVFHPGWLPHARMHTVWLLGATSGVGIIALAALWAPRGPLAGGIHLAGLLSIVVYGAFFLSAATTPLYGGALTDMEGGVGDGPFGFDANLFTFSIATAVLLLGWFLGRERA